jgi:hypothetical protein
LAKQEFTAATLVALRKALSTAYWYKKDLRSFLEGCLSKPKILEQFHWEQGDPSKIDIVNEIFNIIKDDSNNYNYDVAQISTELSKLNDNNFEHLKLLDQKNGSNCQATAKQNYKEFARLLKPSQDETKRQETIKQNKHKIQQEKNDSKLRKTNLEDIKNRFVNLQTSSDPQNRGFELEKIMYDLFKHFNLDPKASFKNMGEQIDGAFILKETHHFLLECKWTKTPSEQADLVVFLNKVNTKLQNTYGIFLSINGFSSNAIDTPKAGDNSILLVDGTDLFAVLDERICFTELITKKKTHAHRTGKIYLPFSEMIKQKNT